MQTHPATAGIKILFVFFFVCYFLSKPQTGKHFVYVCYFMQTPNWNIVYKCLPPYLLNPKLGNTICAFAQTKQTPNWEKQCEQKTLCVRLYSYLKTPNQDPHTQNKTIPHYTANAHHTPLQKRNALIIGRYRYITPHTSLMHDKFHSTIPK